MNMNTADLTAFTRKFIPLVADAETVEIVIAPPFTLLDRLAQQIAGTAIQTAGQNVNPEQSGAFTGEIAAGMLADTGCAYGIVGHSERRALYGERDEFIARKAAALLEQSIRPIVCVGETLEQRDAGRELEVVGAQLRESLARVPAIRRSGSSSPTSRSGRSEPAGPRRRRSPSRSTRTSAAC
jgi:triosephosphate isomerase